VSRFAYAVTINADWRATSAEQNMRMLAKTAGRTVACLSLDYTDHTWDVGPRAPRTPLRDRRKMFHNRPLLT